MDKSTQIQTKGKTRQTKGVFFFFGSNHTNLVHQTRTPTCKTLIDVSWQRWVGSLGLVQVNLHQWTVIWQTVSIPFINMALLTCSDFRSVCGQTVRVVSGFHVTHHPIKLHKKLLDDVSSHPLIFFFFFSHKKAIVLSHLMYQTLIITFTKTTYFLI